MCRNSTFLSPSGRVIQLISREKARGIEERHKLKNDEESISWHREETHKRISRKRRLLSDIEDNLFLIISHADFEKHESGCPMIYCLLMQAKRFVTERYKFEGNLTRIPLGILFGFFTWTYVLNQNKFPERTSIKRETKWKSFHGHSFRRHHQRVSQVNTFSRCG